MWVKNFEIVFIWINEKKILFSDVSLLVLEIKLVYDCLRRVYF